MKIRSRFARRIALVIVVIATLAGCATFQRQAYNRNAHQDIKVVGLIEPNQLSEYGVVNLGHPGNAFGLIGALIAASDLQSKTKEFSNAVKASGFDLSSDFRRQLVVAIEARGYRVKLLKVDRPKSTLLERYDNLDSEPDAYVDATISGAYLCASSTADYFPAVLSNVRIVKRASREIVYREFIAYGYEWKYGQPIQIAADAKYRFNDFAALMANVPLAMDGLAAGLPKVVAQVDRDLSQ